MQACYIVLCGLLIFANIKTSLARGTYMAVDHWEKLKIHAV